MLVSSHRRRGREGSGGRETFFAGWWWELWVTGQGAWRRRRLWGNSLWLGEPFLYASKCVRSSAELRSWYRVSSFFQLRRWPAGGSLQELCRAQHSHRKRYPRRSLPLKGEANLHLPTEIVSYLLPLLPLSALSTPNTALSTPLHWTSLNYHLSCLRLLCPLLSAPAFTLRNGHQKTAVEEAEEACEAFVVDEGEEGSERGKERVRREVVVGYLLGVMGLGVKKMSGKDEEVMDGLAKSAEGVKLGEEEEVVMKSEDVL